MPKHNLTQTFVDNIKPNANKPYVDYIDLKLSGLILKSLRSGKLTYYVQYTDANNIRQTKRLSSVDASGMSLEMARQLCIEKLSLVAQGIDPFPKAIVVETVPTVSQFVDKHYLPHIKSYKKSWGTDVSLLNNHILPKLGKLKLNEIKRHHLVELFSEHRLSHAAGSTNRM